ncbi:recombinase family protein [Natronobacterium gregoryi]|uniref:Resolvase n=2 Tax=Natronobacterium gregoryi TaxID=44930 RepID=L0AKQ0_NATGS|nr:recombinase family protein [Natronobacterium gregoryi]AFZ73752.1 site-specific recombinase, DNA invertase Pin [Natronobacterium gregoryi SP2]ELY65810.1 Resolvase domain-containing protein [Natronobacterium gregoryi SP2]PLK19440.1 resolvase [Natronobacterium gregoryi SP2]SFJ48397.1 Site-specific DNA recombinase [Natronobacterium gregoryi]
MAQSDTKSTLIYARVSTEDQDLSHQEENLWNYATDSLGFPEDDIDVLRDKSTGTNIDRSGYREMMERVRAGDAESIIVREISRIGRDIRDIHDTVYEIVDDHDCGLYIKNDGLEVDADEELDIAFKSTMFGLSLAAEIKAKKVKENTLEGLRAAEQAGKCTTRPPYGFTTDDEGYLQPTDEFSNAREAIEAVEELGWSHRKTARHTGVPRRTIPNILERKDLYLTTTIDRGDPGESA